MPLFSGALIVITDKLELTDLTFTGGNVRVKDGQLQIWDPTAAINDATRPWRSVGCDNGQLFVSDVVLN